MIGTQNLKISIWIFLWFTSSIMLNIQWKSTLNNYGLTKSSSNQADTHQLNAFVLYFTVVQFATGALTSFLVLLWKGKHTILLSSSELWKKGFAIGNLFFLGQLFTNGSLTMTSVTLTHTIKSLEPLLALIWTLTILKNKISCLALLYIPIMVFGVIIVGFNDLSFHKLGFVFAMCSNFSLSLRNLFIKLFTENEKNSDGLFLFFISCLYGFFTSLMIYFLILINRNMFSDYHNIPNIETIKIGLFFSGQHIMSYLLLDYLTIVSHALTNCLKRTLIIFISAIFLGNYLPPIQILGILIALFGSICYIQETYIPLEDSSHTTNTAAPRKTTWHWSLLLLLMAFIGPLSFSLLSRHNNSERPIYSKVQENITGVWGFDAPLNENSLRLVNGILNTNTNMGLNIFCSNVVKCQKSVNEHPSFSSSIHIYQLKAFELSVNTPVAGWMASHPINKIKSLECFPVYFHKMVYISTLWKYGGIVIDMALYTDNIDMNTHIDTSSFTGCLLDQDRSSTIICGLPPRHNTTNIIFEQVLNNFNNHPRVCMFTKFNESLHYYDINALNTGIGYRTPSNEVVFGLLGYHMSNNIGDEVQSMAAAHILPYINTFINRYDFRNDKKINITYIGNGFWQPKGILFKNIPNLNTIPVAVHIVQDKNKWFQSRDLLKAMAPIGARDTATYALLNKNGIESRFSGCLTLWMKNPDLFQNIHKTDDIIIVDLKWKCTAYPACNTNPLPETLKNVKHLSHVGFDFLSQEERYTKAYDYLMQYAKAKVVVTSRIHVALPCVALGTPVIFMSSSQLDGSDTKHISPRLAGLLDLFHTVDMMKMNEKEALEYFMNFNWDSPPPNPNPEKVKVLKDEARKILERSPELAVSIKVFEFL